MYGSDGCLENSCYPMYNQWSDKVQQNVQKYYKCMSTIALLVDFTRLFYLSDISDKC